MSPPLSYQDVGALVLDNILDGKMFVGSSSMGQLIKDLKIVCKAGSHSTGSRCYSYF